jgi:hypothetical protein
MLGWHWVHGASTPILAKRNIPEDASTAAGASTISKVPLVLNF